MSQIAAPGKPADFDFDAKLVNATQPAVSNEGTLLTLQTLKAAYSGDAVAGTAIDAVVKEEGLFLIEAMKMLHPPAQNASDEQKQLAAHLRAHYSGTLDGVVKFASVLKQKAIEKESDDLMAKPLKEVVDKRAATTKAFFK
jgi:hypothetical protein